MASECDCKSETNFPPPICIIIGPTGVGKSKLGIELAKSLNGEIVSIDSIQCYKGLDIASNKVSVEEQKTIPHHLLSSYEPWEQIDIRQYVQSAEKIIDNIQERLKHPFVVGGTAYWSEGLLFNSFVSSNCASFSAEDSNNSQSHSSHLSLLSPEEKFALLQKVDPTTAQTLHPNNIRKVDRALEVFYETGQPLSTVLKTTQTGLKYRRRCLMILLQCDKKVLDSRLDSRIDNMMKNGLLQEVETIYQSLLNRTGEIDLKSGIGSAIGFKEFYPFLVSDKNSPNRHDILRTSIENLKTATRQYAKKQTKFIRSRLLPYASSPSNLDSAGLFVLQLDATNIDEASWSENILNPALRVAAAFFNKSSLPKEDLPKLLDPAHANLNLNHPASSNQHHHCSYCDKLIVGDDSKWLQHTSSKSHRKRKDAFNRREQGNVSQKHLKMYEHQRILNDSEEKEEKQ